MPPYVEGEFRRYLECGIPRFRGGGAYNARHMAEVAAYLMDQVFPPLPVHQWVLSVPKRLRHFLQRDPEALSAVLHIFLRVIEARLLQRSGCARAAGAVSFVQRFGSALNAPGHFHCCVIDAVFAAGAMRAAYGHCDQGASYNRLAGKATPT